MGRPILPEEPAEIDSKMWAGRLPRDVREMLKEMAVASGLSQAKVFTNVMRWAYPYWRKQLAAKRAQARR